MPLTAELQSIPHAGSVVAAPSSRARVLYVDDDELQVELGKRILESVGHSVDTQTSALEALAAVSADPEKYDLVITDQRMPDLIGSALAEEIHSIRPDLPMILVTGDHHTLARTKQLTDLFEQVLSKPVSVALLRSTVETVLAR